MLTCLASVGFKPGTTRSAVKGVTIGPLHPVIYQSQLIITIDKEMYKSILLTIHFRISIE